MPLSQSLPFSQSTMKCLQRMLLEFSLCSSKARGEGLDNWEYGSTCTYTVKYLLPSWLSNLQKTIVPGMPLLLRLALTLSKIPEHLAFTSEVFMEKNPKLFFEFPWIVPWIVFLPEQAPTILMLKFWKNSKYSNKKICVFPYRGTSLFKGYFKLTAISFLLTFYIKQIMFSFPV